MDGVIVDSEPLHVAAFRAVLGRYGHNLTDDHYKDHFAGRTDEAGFKAYFEFVGETVDMPVIMDEKAKAYLALAGDQLVPYPGVIELITHLGKQGTPMALVTGSLKNEAMITLQAFTITDYFGAIIAAEDITESKPNPEGYLKGAAALSVNPADCIVIEDAPKGVRAARAAGMRCLAVTTTHAAAELQEATSIVDQLDTHSLNAL